MDSQILTYCQCDQGPSLINILQCKFYATQFLPSIFIGCYKFSTNQNA